MNPIPNRTIHSGKKSNRALIFTSIGLFVLGLLVYIGIPYTVWLALNPVTFWQKTATLVEFAIYEAIVIPFGMMIIGGIIAVLA